MLSPSAHIIKPDWEIALLIHFQGLVLFPLALFRDLSLGKLDEPVPS